jgi:hypothetical protein
LLPLSWYLPGWEGILRQGASQKTCLWPVGIRVVLAIWNFDAAAHAVRPLRGRAHAALHLTTEAVVPLAGTAAFFVARAKRVPRKEVRHAARRQNRYLRNVTGMHRPHRVRNGIRVIVLFGVGDEIRKDFDGFLYFDIGQYRAGRNI